MKMAAKETASKPEININMVLGLIIEQTPPLEIAVTDIDSIKEIACAPYPHCKQWGFTVALKTGDF